MIDENYTLDRRTDSGGFFYIDSRRIDWIDIAKGIAILLVIVGHTVKFGGTARNFIFSFYLAIHTGLRKINRNFGFMYVKAFDICCCPVF